ncbi:MAG: hypothetical protein ACR2RL_08150, partial [Gammaproteobacteria bacterium]
MRFFYFVEQHNAEGSIPDVLRQRAGLPWTVADEPRDLRRMLELAHIQAKQRLSTLGLSTLGLSTLGLSGLRLS